ncbi:hypothetical protein AGOR_G00062150 [Albula goreensis]|uniref:Uncharacterized protein n=1 Tax=Albula goreensis TaxID=1534307 RepID=A0A8T3DS13_9TELE|nr:hypothetical protein AGOR_G00062150 [Albula goreensis]
MLYGLGTVRKDTGSMGKEADVHWGNTTACTSKNSAIDKTQACQDRSGFCWLSPTLRKKLRRMENQLAITIMSYICIFLASTDLMETNYISCNRTTFMEDVNHSCIPKYNQAMTSINYQDRCPWPSKKWSYIDLIACVDTIIRRTGCVEPSIKDEVFLEIHRTYFSLCSYKQDPDFPTLLLLILPCILTTLILPFMCVHITTCNTL